MNYCELWLEMKSGMRGFRVALLVPEGQDVPDEFSLAEYQERKPERELYVSEWFEQIALAKGLMVNTASYFNERSIQYLFFQEIRPMTKAPDT